MTTISERNDSMFYEKGLIQKLKQYFEEAPLKVPQEVAQSNDESVRILIIFEGIVQGVGFRFEVGRTADYLGLTGWVRNLANGTVEAEVQGDRSKIEYFCEYLNSIKRIKITNIKKTELPLNQNEMSFRIIY